jgi:hypothetical protein
MPTGQAAFLFDARPRASIHRPVADLRIRQTGNSKYEVAAGGLATKVRHSRQRRHVLDRPQCFEVEVIGDEVPSLL